MADSSKTIDYESLVAEYDPEYPFFIHPAYEFSRKTYYEDDNAGNYNKPFPPEEP